MISPDQFPLTDGARTPAPPPPGKPMLAQPPADILEWFAAQPFALPPTQAMGLPPNTEHQKPESN